MRTILEKAFNSSMKIKLGTRVETQQIGPKTRGKVVGIFVPDSESPNPYVNEHSFSIWSGFYPECRNKETTLLKLDQPRKPFTLEECLAQGGTEKHYECVPAFIFCYHPVEDLVIIGDNN